MKRIISVTLIVIFLFLPLLTACGVKQVNDSLTVFFDSTLQYARGAMAQFEQMSGVDVTMYEQLKSGASQEERETYFQKLKSEIMAGNGPDVFILKTEFGEELYKIIEAGAFMDFDELIASDAEFSLSEYEETVMDTGVYAGKRYMMPLNYTVPLFMTTQGKMSQFEVEREDFSTYANFLSTTLQLQEQGIALNVSPYSATFLCYTGGWLQEMLDYEEKTVDVDSPTVSQCIRLLQQEYALHPDYSGVADLDHAASVAYEEGLFNYCHSLVLETMYLSNGRNDADIEMLPIPNYFGETTAYISEYCMISSTSPNMKNAWEFVKILLDDTCQNEMYLTDSGVGVKNGSMDINIDSSARRNSSSGSIPDKYLEQVKSYYKACDQAVLLYNHSGANTYRFYLQDVLRPGEAADIEELLETAENGWKLWLSE